MKTNIIILILVLCLLAGCGVKYMLIGQVWNPKFQYEYVRNEFLKTEYGDGISNNARG